MEASPKRIAVIGCSGSGKSTLAAHLAARLGLPFRPTDEVYWRPDWTPAPMSEVRTWLDATTAEAAWVLDGNFDDDLALSWDRADLIVWLDLPRALVLARVARRNLGWWLSGKRIWGGQVMTLKRVITGLRHAARAYRIKRANYPGWLADRPIPQVRLQSPAAVRRWLAGLP